MNFLGATTSRASGKGSRSGVRTGHVLILGNTDFVIIIYLFVCVPTQHTDDQLQRNLSTKKHEPKQVHHATQGNAKTRQHSIQLYIKVTRDRQSAFA